MSKVFYNLKILFIYCFSVSLVSCGTVNNSNSVSDNLHLMPYPQNVEMKKGRFQIGSGFSIRNQGVTSTRLESAIIMARSRLERQIGVDINSLKSSHDKPGRFLIVVESAGKDIPSLSDNESYELTVAEDQILLMAKTEYGALRGIETFLQLVQPAKDRHLAYVPLVEIADQPRFKWRGVLIDSARHFLPIDTLKRQIDGMAAAKLNVFHWHLTDDQGWRIESRLFPKLHELASDGDYYTQDQIREIVSYAAQRGIRVVPEIDMPGHASVYGVAYPELMSAPGPYEVETGWGVFEPTLDPSNEDVYAFIDKLMGEMSGLFTDKYVHIGGDEVNPTHWQNNSKIKKFMESNSLKTYPELQAYFNARVAKILKNHNRFMIGWDEVFHEDLPESVVVQSWRGQDSLAKISRAGYQGLLSTGYYVDQAHSSSFHYRTDPLPEKSSIHDELFPGDEWESYQFEWPRKKGGPVKGQFSIIKTEEGIKHGFVDFAGKSRRQIRDLQSQKGLTTFWLDSWMGRTEFRVNLDAAKKPNVSVNALAIAANGHYPMTFKKVGGSDIQGAKLLDNEPPQHIDNPNNILGGEMALWGELVNKNVIDIRLWPRAFVIAERFWSPQDVTDEDDMYNRLEIVSDWAEKSVGLQHRKLSTRMMEKLSGGRDIAPLRVFAEAVEQAGYYHRHHEKFVAGNYDKFEPLDKLVDSLPAESLQIRRLDKLVDRWLARPGDEKALLELKAMLTRWHENYLPLTELINSNPKLSNLNEPARNVEAVSLLGLELISKIERGSNLSAAEVEKARSILFDAQQFQSELVVSAAYPVGKLLNAAY